MTATDLKRAGILATLRLCRQQERADIDVRYPDWIAGFHAGRAHAFRFALALLDEDGPEAQELESVEADVAPEVKKRG